MLSNEKKEKKTNKEQTKKIIRTLLINTNKILKEVDYKSPLWENLNQIENLLIVVIKQMNPDFDSNTNIDGYQFKMGYKLKKKEYPCFDNKNIPFNFSLNKKELIPKNIISTPKE